MKEKSFGLKEQIFLRVHLRRPHFGVKVPARKDEYAH